jgi:hypothetical protein
VLHSIIATSFQQLIMKTFVVAAEKVIKIARKFDKKEN